MTNFGILSKAEIAIAGQARPGQEIAWREGFCMETIMRRVYIEVNFHKEISMKLFWTLSLFAITSTAFAFERIPSKVTCTDSRGFQLIIEDKGLDGSFQIPLQVSVVNEGAVFARDVFRLQTNTAEEMRLEGHDSESGNIVTVLVDKVRKEAFRQEAANGGNSPLPGMTYQNCQFE